MRNFRLAPSNATVGDNVSASFELAHVGGADRRTATLLLTENGTVRGSNGVEVDPGATIHVWYNLTLTGAGTCWFSVKLSTGEAFSPKPVYVVPRQ